MQTLLFKNLWNNLIQNKNKFYKKWKILVKHQMVVYSFKIIIQMIGHVYKYQQQVIVSFKNLYLGIKCLFNLLSCL